MKARYFCCTSLIKLEVVSATEFTSKGPLSWYDGIRPMQRPGNLKNLNSQESSQTKTYTLLHNTVNTMFTTTCTILCTHI